MAKSAAIPSREREARVKAVKILDSKPIICGSIVQMVHTCGKSNCRCTRGEKHVSHYLATRSGRKRKMISLPTELEMDVRQWVRNYRDVSQTLQVLSRSSLKRLMAKKKG